eukprot:TRINITY_DN3673_c0_g2_i1.p1 TRINITY_DN3673_c0_g2~~TRINITY_DN3673_c0_g2_i1.p1  ORF type:complete len:597 (+),score=160.53 TRINITY_DN3673_c0_g2_i1:109-1899(+)
MMKKLMAQAESALGVDLDGDGKVGGKPMAQAGRGGYSGAPPAQGGWGGQPQQGGWGQPPPQQQQQPQGGWGGGGAGYPGMGAPQGGAPPAAGGYPGMGGPPGQQPGYGAPPPQGGGYGQPQGPPAGAGPPGGFFGAGPPGGPPGGQAPPGGYGAPPGPPGGGGPPQGQYGGPPQGQYGGAPQQAGPPGGGFFGAGAPGQAPGGMPPPGGGNKKALLIGINYVGQQGQLGGCHNDVKTIQALLRKLGFSQGNYQEVVLVDDRQWQGAMMPTKAEILRAFQWLASNNKPGDTLFFHYSGHGGQVRDKDGDEGDGYDETLIPVDFKQAGQITDDEIFARLVQPLPAGVRMTAVMDCCHSGTAMDLPYIFKANQNAMKGALANPASIAMVMGNKKQLQKMALNMAMGALGLGGGSGGGRGGGMGGALGGFFGGGAGRGGGGGGGGAAGRDSNKQCASDVIMFSGCDDSQTSADVANVAKFGLPQNAGPGGSGGACTNALAAVLHRNPNLTMVQLLEEMRLELSKRGFKQVPQLTSSKPVDLSTQFSLQGSIQASRAAPVEAPPGYWGAYAQGPQAGYFSGQAPAGGYQQRPPADGGGGEV